MADKYELRDILNRKTTLNPIWIDTLISKLDPEMIEMLMMIVEDCDHEAIMTGEQNVYYAEQSSYKEGYDDGYREGSTDAHGEMDEEYKKAYDQGVEDGWGQARHAWR